MEGSGILRIVFGLILVVGALLLSAWLAKRFGFADNLRNRFGSMRVLSSLSLGPRHRMAVVAVEDARLVIGIGPQGITLLHTLPPAPPEPPQTVPEPVGFQAVLAKWLGNTKP